MKWSGKCGLLVNLVNTNRPPIYRNRYPSLNYAPNVSTFMNIKPFTRRGMDTIRQSLDYVSRYRHCHVGIEHLLLVFTTPDSETAVTIHTSLAEPLAKIRETVESQIETGKSDGTKAVPQTQAAKQVLYESMRIAETLGHVGVNPEHMMLALLDLDSEPLVNKLTETKNIDIDFVRKHLAFASQLDKYTTPSPPKMDG